MIKEIKTKFKLHDYVHDLDYGTGQIVEINLKNKNYPIDVEFDSDQSIVSYFIDGASGGGLPSLKVVSYKEYCKLVGLTYP